MSICEHGCVGIKKLSEGLWNLAHLDLAAAHKFLNESALGKVILDLFKGEGPGALVLLALSKFLSFKTINLLTRFAAHAGVAKNTIKASQIHKGDRHQD